MARTTQQSAEEKALVLLRKAGQVPLFSARKVQAALATIGDGSLKVQSATLPGKTRKLATGRVVHVWGYAVTNSRGNEVSWGKTPLLALVDLFNRWQINS